MPAPSRYRRRRRRRLRHRRPFTAAGNGSNGRANAGHDAYLHGVLALARIRLTDHGVAGNSDLPANCLQAVQFQRHLCPPGNASGLLGVHEAPKNVGALLGDYQTLGRQRCLQCRLEGIPRAIALGADSIHQTNPEDGPRRHGHNTGRRRWWWDRLGYAGDRRPEDWSGRQLPLRIWVRIWLGCCGNGRR